MGKMQPGIPFPSFDVHFYFLFARTCKDLSFLCFDYSFLAKYTLAKLVGLSLELASSSVNSFWNFCQVYLGKSHEIEFGARIELGQLPIKSLAKRYLPNPVEQGSELAPSSTNPSLNFS